MNTNIRAARRAGVPLVCIESSDPAQTISGTLRDLNGKIESEPQMQWDCIRGLTGLNDKGRGIIGTLTSSDETLTIEPSMCLKVLAKCEAEKAVCFFLNAHRFWVEPDRMQAIWNLRDAWKARGSTLVMIVPSADSLPAELKPDVVVLTERAPDEERIGEIIAQVAEEARLTSKIKDTAKLTDTLLGYPSEFAVEQAFAMSLTKEGADVNQLWTHRVQAMKSLAGLEMTLPQENYSALAGCQGVKSFLNAYLNGRRPPRVVFWLDEIEKMVAGSGTDTSGVTQALLEQFLFWTEQQKVDACLFLGVPGSGKSWTARTTAGQARVPLARGSMSTVKGSLVGQSEGNMKQMLKAVSAIGQGRILLLATCNSLNALPPEVMARFKLGTTFFDYPTADEELVLWEQYIQQYELRDKPLSRPKWVGREIESCCHRAWLFKVSLDAASTSVVPVSIASAEKMERLRKSASGRFNAAAYPGIYDSERGTGEKPDKRKMEV